MSITPLQWDKAPVADSEESERPRLGALPLSGDVRRREKVTDPSKKYERPRNSDRSSSRTDS
jgi:hypothetical protein